ncbi:MAG: hypothetical protein HQL15_08945, partial [Candidatus Omnitrophica bacterium]|nr:hypothetical protein [Candidatus Omnitrophota bacterium]
MVVERTSRNIKVFLPFFFKILFIVILGSFAQTSHADTISLFKDNSDGSRTLSAHVPSQVAMSKIQYHAYSNEMLDLQIILPLRNQAQLNDLLNGIYDPNSPLYHQFLTPEQFNSQFSPSEGDANQIKNFFSARGFAVKGQTPNGTVLTVSGSVPAIEHLFRLHINHYINNSDGTPFFAPDADPTISAEIVGKVSAIAGLDNLVRFKPHLHQAVPHATDQANAQVATPQMGTGPLGFLSPDDVKIAYNLNNLPSVNDPSSLQNIALFELDGYLQTDILNYEAQFIKTPVNNDALLSNVYIDGFDGKPTISPNSGSDEVTLDIEQVIGIALNAINKIYVYEAKNSVQGWINEWSRIASDNTSKIVSCSWGWSEETLNPDGSIYSYSPAIAFDNGIFAQMAVQGQAVFVASGDAGAFNNSANPNQPIVDEPASQPYVTGVGITTLSINTNKSYKGEIASIYGGGGVSRFFSIPSYQLPLALKSATGSKVSKTMRNVPDVSLTADLSTAYSFYFTKPNGVGRWYGFWGSSIAAPTWAAFLAQVNQARVHLNKGVIGFFNASLYPLANSSKYTNDFHDVLTGSNQFYPAQTGYDASTGLGSLNGLNLYNDLLSLAVAAVPPTVSVSAGNASVALSWGAISGAVSYRVKKSTVSGGPYTTIVNSMTGTSYTDTLVTNGTTYYYVVSALNGVGEGANSQQVIAIPQQPKQPNIAQVVVAAPTNLGISNYLGSQLLLSWTQSISPNVNRNKVYLSVGAGSTNYVLLGTLNVNTAKTVGVWITGLSAGITYNFKVTAVNVSGIESKDVSTSNVAT